MSMRNSMGIFLVCVACCATPAAEIRGEEQAKSEGPLRIGSQLQLFLDDWLTDSMRNVQLKLHRPRPAEIVLHKDKPWEDSTMYDPVVMHDAGKYRMWYRTNFNKAPFYTGYAESKDGIHWTKPALGLVDFQDSKANNIVWAGNHGVENGGPTVLSVFKDPNPDTPEGERYKATGLTYGRGLQGLVSPDGLRWRLLQKERVVPANGAFDTHSICLWDSARSRYVVYTRGFVNGVRRIRRTASKDFRKFPAPQLITVVNPPGQSVEHLYKNAATPYYRRPDIMLMFPKRFVPQRKLDPKWPQSGLSDIVFMFSRDGIRFDRRFREAFIRPGLDQLNWHERAIEVGPGLVPTGSNEMSLYYMEHYRTDSVRIRRGVLRVDGLVSVNANDRGGELVTRPLVFEGNRLQINFSTSAAGSVRIELMDAGSRPQKLFTLAECPEIYGDKIEHTVTWTSGANVGQLAGKPVRLRIVMQDADLYSFRFGK